MAITRMVRNAVHITEFAPSTWGEEENGTCTFAGAAMALASAQGKPTTQQGVIDLMLSMKDACFKRGTCAANGAATIAAVAEELRNRGASIAVEWDYAGDTIPHDWHTLIKENAGIRPIVIQTASAFMLYDVAGVHEDANVHYHAYAIMGVSTQGYIVGDPNNPTVMQTFDIYPYSAQASDGKQYGIAPASPCGLIMLNMQDTPQPSPSGGTTTSLPTAYTEAGWSDDGSHLVSPPGSIDKASHHFEGALREYALQLIASGVMSPADVALQEMVRDDAAGRYSQMTSYHLLIKPDDGAAFIGNIGASLFLSEQQIAADTRQIADLHDQLQGATQAVQQLQAEKATDAQTIAQADALVEQLKAQIAQLQGQPTPAPTPSPLGDQLIALIRQAAQGGN